MSRNRRDRRKRRGIFALIWRPLKYIAAIAAILAAVGAFFKISDIHTQGNVIYSQEEIVNASGLEKGDSLFFINRKAAKREIYNSFVYIDDVKLRVKSPNTVIIEVVEAEAVVYVEYEGNRLLLNRNGKLLGIDNESTLTRVYGILPQETEVGAPLSVADTDKDKLDCAKELVTLLEQHDMLLPVGWIDVTNTGDISLEYGEQYIIKLGAWNEMEDNLNFALSIMDSIGPDEKGTIDLSIDKGGHFIPR